MYKRPSERLDRLGMDMNDPRMPALVRGFSSSIRDHEHQIADLVLSICARALTGQNDAIGEALTKVANREAGYSHHPQEILSSPYMNVALVDSGLLADAILFRTGHSRTSGAAERLLTEGGWREIQNFGSALGGTSRDGRSTFNRAALWAKSRSGVHRLSGTALYSALDKALSEQVATSKILALPHIYWHSSLAHAYLIDARGEIVSADIPKEISRKLMEAKGA